jgi:squalene-hopene/tetraprenyl-beta-curcumene cyclase
MHSTTHSLTILCGTLGFCLGGIPALFAEDSDWMRRAGQYLDNRAQAWFDFRSADRGTGATKTSCVSCHTLLPYALARPILRKLAGQTQPTSHERSVLNQVRMRVEHWGELDSPAYRLLYDFSQQKKRQARGTEAVLNALILAFEDHQQGRKQPDAITRKAFANLWQTQVRTGEQAGSWDWLNFGLEPWESTEARFYGATMAAIAVGTAPGYYTTGTDAVAEKGVTSLLVYLRSRLAAQNLNNRIWMLWAGARLGGILTSEERSKTIEVIFAKQQPDGGWSLASLGSYPRSAKAPADNTSDGYATGLVLHVLQTAGLTGKDARVARGLTWLRSHQANTGAWRTDSVNKDRDPATHVGKFMSDAATAFAVLALSH